MDYEKPTYRMFVVWLAAFFAVTGGVAAFFVRLAPGVSDGVVTKVLLLAVMAMLDLLLYYIYRTGRVYWFTGLTYKQAAEAGGDRRRAYARAHLRRFLLASAVFVAYCAAGFALRTGVLLDTIVFLVLLLVAVFSTMRIKL